jgi:hypothetical protein
MKLSSVISPSLRVTVFAEDEGVARVTGSLVKWGSLVYGPPQDEWKTCNIG